jgi:hypothetical protein
MWKVIYSFLDRIMHSGLCSPVGLIIPILRKIDGLISSGHDVNHQQSTLNRSSLSFRFVSLMLHISVNGFRIMSEISCQCLCHAYRSLIEVPVAWFTVLQFSFVPHHFGDHPLGSRISLALGPPPLQLCISISHLSDFQVSDTSL